MTYEESRTLFDFMVTARVWSRMRPESCQPRFLAPDATWIDQRAEIGEGTLVFPGCLIMGKSRIGKNCILWPNSVLFNDILGDGVTFGLPHQRNSKIGDGAVVGALSEFNNSSFGKGVKYQHHGYLGNAEVGGGSNIGAGTITANFDGKNKHETVFGPNCSTGIHTSIVAPNKFPEGITIAAGSLIIANITDVLRRLGQELRPYSLLRSLVLNFRVTARENKEK